MAVIDSGIEAGHPQVGEVQHAVSVEEGDTDDDVRFVEGPHDDLYGHGTACAGIIRGLAPDVEPVSVRVLGPDLKGSAFDFAHGLNWCIEHGVHVVNLSLSTSNEDYAETFYDLLDQAARANVLVVPDLEAGNMLAKSLSFLAGADAAGIVLGAKVPIILTSRADSVMTRLASCAVAALVASARREKTGKAVA